MKAIVKAMWIDSAVVSLEEYAPDDPDFFGFWIEFKVGAENRDGADDFRLFVCTPDWIKNNNSSAVWGRHMLMLPDYDLDVIKKEINKCIESCIGNDWTAIAAKISRYASWEFEDYES